MNRTTAVDAVPSTMDNVARFSTAVIVGTLDGFGAAEWNTKSGTRPETGQNLAVLIFRPIEITPVTALRGDLSIVKGARVEGGAIGCDSDRFSSEPTLKEGSSYAFFLQPEWDTANARSADPWVIWAWPINADGTVQTPLEGDATVATLSQVLAQTPVVAMPTPMPSASP